MKMITVAICTYNRAGNLSCLIRELRAQESHIPFEILVVNNNSTDGTEQLLTELAMGEGAPLRFVTEKSQGIVHARNRAIEESLGSTYLAFIDDDELPAPGWLRTAVDALDREEAECVGGEIQVRLPLSRRPHWLDDEILPFLGEVKNGPVPFWVSDRSTPVWSGNVAYRMDLFAHGLRFDERYNRAGNAVGGGEDYIMFCELLERGTRIRYRNEMLIWHLVEEWKLKRKYFLRIHFQAGWKRGRWSAEEYPQTFFGVPPFMVTLAVKQWCKTLALSLCGSRCLIRQAMNAIHACGMIVGRFQRWRDGLERAC